MSRIDDSNNGPPPSPGVQAEATFSEGDRNLTASPPVAPAEKESADATEIDPVRFPSDDGAQRGVEADTSAFPPEAETAPVQSNSDDGQMRHDSPGTGDTGAGTGLGGGDNIVPFPSRAEPQRDIAGLNAHLPRSAILYNAQVIASTLKAPNPLVLANLIALIHRDNFCRDHDEEDGEASPPASDDELRAALSEMQSAAKRVQALAPAVDQMLAVVKLKSATSLGRFYEAVEVAALTHPREPGQGDPKPTPSRREALLQGLMLPIVQYVSLYERDYIDSMIDGAPEIRRFFNNIIRMVFDAAGWGGFFSAEEINDAYFEVGWALLHQESQEIWEPGDDPYNAMDAEADWLFEGDYLFDGPIAKVDRASFGT